MKIVILAVGSRGDVQPYVALGRGLVAQGGHHVTIAAVEHFEQFVRENGLEFAPLAGNVGAMLNSDAAVQAMESGSNTLRAIRQLIKMIEPQLIPLFEDCWLAAQHADLIITSTLGVVGFPIGKKLGVPVVPALPYPLLSPTGDFASPAWPFRNQLPGMLGQTYNCLTHYLAEQFAWQPFKGYLNRWIEERLDLRPYPFFGPYRQLRQDNQPILYGYSSHVIPRPATWGPHEAVTGYWFLDQPDGFQPPSSLVEFIEAGSMPVYLGFGSMIHRDPAYLISVILEALHKTDRRAVLLSGWAGLGNEAVLEDDRVFVVDSVPHSWLFPQMAAVIHHGGAGTTAAGLRAGIPSIITPFFGDQAFWAQIVYQRGVGTKPLPVKNLTSAALAERIEQAVTDNSLRQKAAELGQRIRAEDGVAVAVDYVNQWFAG